VQQGDFTEEEKASENQGRSQCQGMAFLKPSKNHNSKDFPPTPQLFKENVFDTNQKNNTRASH
jgi:hypothetical protein